jgi:hypothetical protein
MAWVAKVVGMRISFKCQACGTTGKAPEKYAGQSIECPDCKAGVQLPPEFIPPTVGGKQRTELGGIVAAAIAGLGIGFLSGFAVRELSTSGNAPSRSIPDVRTAKAPSVKDEPQMQTQPSVLMGFGRSRDELISPLKDTYRLKDIVFNATEMSFVIGDGTMVRLVGPKENVRQIFVISSMEDRHATEMARAMVRLGEPLFSDPKWITAWLGAAILKVSPEFNISYSKEGVNLMMARGEVNDIDVVILELGRRNF